MNLIQYAGRDPKGQIRFGIERLAALNRLDFAGWAALTFRDLDTGRLITPALRRGL